MCFMLYIVFSVKNKTPAFHRRSPNPTHLHWVVGSGWAIGTEDLTGSTRGTQGGKNRGKRQPLEPPENEQP